MIGHLRRGTPGTVTPTTAVTPVTVITSPGRAMANSSASAGRADPGDADAFSE